VHARNWIWSIDVWCNENGLDGLSSPLKLLWFGASDNSSYAYGYVTIAFGSRFWHDTTDRFGFKSLGKCRGFGDPDRIAMNCGQTYLHELMHLDSLASSPQSRI
jgi:hypothetical protein